MATNWANKFNNRWFVRVDGRGIPVYGSLISRAYKPTGYGNNRFIDITACLPNQICCITPADTFELLPDDFEVGGQVEFNLANEAGDNLLSVTFNNAGTHSTTLTDLVSYLNTNYPGFGTFSTSGNIISLAPAFEGLVLDAAYTPAISGTINPAGFAAATNVTFAVPGFIPTITTVKGATLAATLTTIVANLDTNYSGLGDWTAITNGIRLDDRQVQGVTITLGYS